MSNKTLVFIMLLIFLLLVTPQLLLAEGKDDQNSLQENLNSKIIGLDEAVTEGAEQDGLMSVQPSGFEEGAVLVTTGSMNMRTGPGTGYSIIETYPVNTYAEILNNGLNGTFSDGFYWWYVEIDGSGQRGWFANTANIEVVEPPEPPSLTSPADNATGVSTRPTFNWQSVNNVDQYYLIIVADYLGEEGIIKETTNTSFSLSFADELKEGELHVWSVVAENKGGISEDYESRSFTTEEPEESCNVSRPDKPTGPEYGELDRAGLFSAVYNTGGASCSAGHDVEYRFDWGDGNISLWTDSTSMNMTWSEPGSFQIKAKARCAANPAKESSWSPVHTLTIVEEDEDEDDEIPPEEDPNKPVNQEPHDGATQACLEPELSASEFIHPDPAAEHTASQWTITDSSGNLVLDTTTYACLEEYSVVEDDLEFAATYEWKVRYKDDRGKWSQWSEASNFTTMEAPHAEINVISNLSGNLTLDAGNSYSNHSEGEILHYYWDLSGDGMIERSKENSELNIWWLPEGTHNITLTVVDSQGGFSTIDKDVYVAESPYSRWINTLINLSGDEKEKSLSPEFINWPPDWWVMMFSNLDEIDDWVRELDGGDALSWVDENYTAHDVVNILEKEIDPRAMHNAASNLDWLDPNDIDFVKQSDYTYEMHILSMIEEETMVHNSYRFEGDPFLPPAAERSIRSTGVQDIISQVFIGMVPTIDGIAISKIAGYFDPALKMGYTVYQIHSKLNELEEASVENWSNLNYRVGFLQHVHGDFSDRDSSIKRAFREDIRERVGFNEYEEIESDAVDKIIDEVTSQYDVVIDKYDSRVETGEGIDSNYRSKVRQRVKDLINELLSQYYRTALYQKEEIQYGSPVELQVYDEDNNVSGVVDGEVVEEIDSSVYFPEEKRLLIYEPEQEFRRELTGTDDGTYELSIYSRRGKDGNPDSLSLTEVSTSLNERHHYNIDWGAHSAGEKSITIEKDYDGDGEIDEIVNTAAPRKPFDPRPVNLSIGESLQPALEWQGGDDHAGKVRYRIYFGTKEIPPLKKTTDFYPADQEVVTIEPFTGMENLEAGTTYYWKVEAVNDFGVTRESPLWQFETADEPDDIETIGDLRIGDRVVDPSWQWEFRTGDDYTREPGDETRPVTWLVVAEGHYRGGTGVTLLSEELIGRHVFDDSTNRGDEKGSNHWGESGTGDTESGLRPWLNSRRPHADEGFYNAFSESFKNSLMLTTLHNREWEDGDGYITSDRVFIPSTSELGDTEQENTYPIGATFPYFEGATDADRVAELDGEPWYYWTRSPDSRQSHYVRHVYEEGNFTYGYPYLGHRAARPAVTLFSKTPVSEEPNADGAYEITGDSGIARLEGADRYKTAVQVSRSIYEQKGSAEAVVLARGDDFADALSGVPLAHAKEAPLLLTTTGELTGSTAAEIERAMGAEGTVYVLGGKMAISENVEEELKDMGYLVERLAGECRYETAVEIAGELTVNPAEVFLATGENFADAVAASSAAAVKEVPILLTGSNQLSEPTEDYLNDHRAFLNEIYVLGGPAAVDQTVFEAAEATSRISGADRWETATEIAEEFFSNPQEITLATGDDFPDALSGGVYAADKKAPVILTGSETLPDAAEDYVQDQQASLEEIRAFGGIMAVHDHVLYDLVEYLE